MRQFAGVIVLLLAAACGARGEEKANTCLDCHSALEANLHVDPQAVKADIHLQKGLSCVDCHGGNAAEPGMEAMAPAAGFRGKLARARIVKVCGECHSDAARMRNFNPSLRTDQLAQYMTSAHGRKLKSGDAKVAVCTDCHGVHGIKPAMDAASSIHPLNIAATCARCHSDGVYMAGRNLPVDQFARYQSSVHYQAMSARGDLSAPTCSTCHGNHGAAPPGVGSVENVCSGCHVVQAALFDSSRHKPIFEAAGFAPCITCHSNHRIAKPTDQLIGTGPQSVCLTCHTQGDDGFKAAGDIQKQLAHLQTQTHNAEELLRQAEHYGIEVGQAKLDLNAARDALTKARVTLHSVDPQRVDADVAAGLKVAEKGRAAGESALKEKDHRRLGLGISVFAVLFVLIGLRLYIRGIEQGGDASNPAPPQA